MLPEPAPAPAAVVVPASRWSVPVPGTRLRVGVGLAVLLVAAAAWAVWLAMGGEAGTDGVSRAAGSAGIAASVLLHEGAHAAAARSLGYRIEWIVVGAFAGRTSYSGRGDRPLDRAAIAMAGPATSAGAVLVVGAAWATGAAGRAEPALVTVAGFNAVTCAVNLLPVPGSDGWFVAAGLAEHRRAARRQRALPGVPDPLDTAES